MEKNFFENNQIKNSLKSWLDAEYKETSNFPDLHKILQNEYSTNVSKIDNNNLDLSNIVKENNSFIIKNAIPGVDKELYFLEDAIKYNYIFIKPFKHKRLYLFNVKIKILPSCFKFFSHRNNNLFIFLKVNRWIVCLIKIKSNFFLLFKKKDVASDFLKLILLSLSL